jgi:hypothetical protein
MHNFQKKNLIKICLINALDALFRIFRKIKYNSIHKIKKFIIYRNSFKYTCMISMWVNKILSSQIILKYLIMRIF